MASYAIEHKVRQMDDRARAEWLEKRVKLLESIQEVLVHTVESFGLGVKVSTNSGVKIYHRAVKRCPVCDGGAVILEDVYTARRFLVICDNCARRTESFPTIREAIIAWNKGEVTELSRVVEQKLTSREMSDEGVGRLLGAITKSAADEYVAAVRAGREPPGDVKWFLDGADRAKEILDERAGVE